jgi:carotenoid cleavage dioxygenase-like enzyme
MPASLGSHAPLSAHPSPPTGADDFRALQKSYPSVDDEPSFALEGDAPRDLVGELIRVGPGKFLGPWQNPVDGDGLVAKIAFDGSGRAMWTARFVETPGFAEERKSGGGAVTRKGVMGTPVGARPGPVKTSGPYRKNIPALGALFGDLTAVQFKNTANTNVVKFQDKLWALWEGGSPFELDPRTLQTRGMFHFGKHVTADMGFTAHPKIVRDGGAGGRTMVAIAVDFRRMALPGGSPLTVLELDEDAPAAAVRATRHKLPQAGALVVHDFSVLDEWVVVIVSPVRLNLLKLAAGYSQQDFMSQAAGVTRVFLLPRKGRTEQRLQSFALQDASHVYVVVEACRAAPTDPLARQATTTSGPSRRATDAWWWTPWCCRSCGPWSPSTIATRCAVPTCAARWSAGCWTLSPAPSPVAGCGAARTKTPARASCRTRSASTTARPMTWRITST